MYQQCWTVSLQIVSFFKILMAYLLCASQMSLNFFIILYWKRKLCVGKPKSIRHPNYSEWIKGAAPAPQIWHRNDIVSVNVPVFLALLIHWYLQKSKILEGFEVGFANLVPRTLLHQYDDNSYGIPMAKGADSVIIWINHLYNLFLRLLTWPHLV